MEPSEDQEVWSSFKLNKQLFNAIADVGYQQPTPIQSKCIPLILGGQEVIGIAQTGTGKTAAYLLPIIMKVKYAQEQGPFALVLAPTKELAVQIAAHAKELAAYTDLRIEAVYGGVGIKSQLEKFKNGIDILVATPGRFMELYLSQEIQVKKIKTLVIDEADRMMDMGFMHQLKKIFEVIPQKRQNLLFSATFPARVEKLSEDFLEFPVKVEITPQSTPAKYITQEFYEVPNLKTKINFIDFLLRHRKGFERVIIFSKTKESANNVFKFIERKRLGSVRVIHSNKGQNTRLNAMNEFKEGNIRVLVSTDVASRGIDISKVTHVINFDVPTRAEDYVHRIGRTGRAFEQGIAITMGTKAELYYLTKIEALIRTPIPQKQLPEEVPIVPTSFEEAQQIARDIDYQKRKEDPSFKGAFHEKKEK